MPLAILSASESIIYRRFGYGLSSLRENWSIERHHTAFSQPHDSRGRLRFVERDEAKSMLPEVCDRAFVERPGYYLINKAQWDLYISDPVEFRDGASAYFFVAYEENGRVQGYVMYRVRETTLRVRELIAVTDEAAASLWRFCFDVDLMTTTEATGRPLDDPLPWMLADPRWLKRLVRDSIWLRLVDVEAALSTRRYAQEGLIVFDLQDSFCPWNEGRIELEGGPDGAQCSPYESTPDITLSSSDLAVAYLGTVSFQTLARAG